MLFRRKKGGDLSLLVVVTALSAFGVLMVYSASSYTAKTQYGDEFFFFRKQAVGFALGLSAMLFTGLFPYERYREKSWFKWVYLLLPALLLALVFVPGIGKSNYGATRWISLGPVTVQPSEIAKYGFALYSSAYLAENPGRVKSFGGILPIVLGGGLYCVLVILEPNMSVTMVIGAVMLLVVFLSGTKMKNFLFLLLPFLALVPVLIIAEPYRLKRLTAFLDPWASPKGEGYQLIQSLYALGNGKWFGTGLFHSRQKYRFLPFAESDFILPVIAEEFGFVGVTLLFFCYLFIVYRGFRISAGAGDLFGSMLALSITLFFGVQTIVNALVVSGSIPPTGLPLPFISSGNTSLILSMAAAGILYNISGNVSGVKKHIV